MDDRTNHGDDGRGEDFDSSEWLLDQLRGDRARDRRDSEDAGEPADTGESGGSGRSGGAFPWRLRPGEGADPLVRNTGASGSGAAGPVDRGAGTPPEPESEDPEPEEIEPAEPAPPTTAAPIVPPVAEPGDEPPLTRAAARRERESAAPAPHPRPPQETPTPEEPTDTAESDEPTHDAPATGEAPEAHPKTDPFAVILPPDFFQDTGQVPAAAEDTTTDDTPPVLLEASYFHEPHETSGHELPPSGNPVTPPAGVTAEEPAAEEPAHRRPQRPQTPPSELSAAAGATAAPMPTRAKAEPAPPSARQSSSGGPPRRRASSASASSGASARTNRTVLWVSAGVLAVIVIVGLFVLGTRLPGMLAAAPAPTPSDTGRPTPSVTPTPTPVPTGPRPAGTYRWNMLRGGECFQPYTSPWANTFTVVDCSTPHAAQLVYMAPFPGADKTPVFPGADKLAAQINLLCTAPGVINMQAAGTVDDLQYQGTYPVTAKQWADGDRSYACFVSRASGQPMVGSVAGPGPAAG